jgi:hypothetical protein
MNRLHVYVVTILIAAFVLLVNVFAAFTFTFAEIIFFVSSILMVFSFEKNPTEHLEKPQIHQYVTNRLNFYNYLAAGNISLFVTLYVLLKYVDPTRALLYLFTAWILCAASFKYIYNYTAFRKFKYSLSDYLILISTKNDELFHVTGDQIIGFVDRILIKDKVIDQSSLTTIARDLKIQEETAVILYTLSQEYAQLTQDPLKSAELP